MKYTYGDIFNTNNKKDENDASIIKVIRPGSDEYDKVHDTTRKVDGPNEYEDICAKMLNDEKFLDEFIPVFINKVNEMFISGQSIPINAYKIYNLFR